MTIDLDPFQYVVYLPKTPPEPGITDLCVGYKVVWNRQGTRVAFIHDLTYPKVNNPTTNDADWKGDSYACTIFNVDGDNVTLAHRIPGKKYHEAFDHGSFGGYWNADGTIFALIGDHGVINRSRSSSNGLINLYGGPAVKPDNEVIVPPPGTPINTVIGSAFWWPSTIVFYETTNWSIVLKVGGTGYETVDQIWSRSFNYSNKILSPSGTTVLPYSSYYYTQNWSIDSQFSDNDTSIIFDDTDPYVCMIGNMKFQFKDNILKVIPFPRDEFVKNDVFGNPIRISWDVYHDDRTGLQPSTSGGEVEFGFYWYANKAFHHNRVYNTTGGQYNETILWDYPDVPNPKKPGTYMPVSHDTINPLDIAFSAQDQYVAFASDYEPYFFAYSNNGQTPMSLATPIDPPITINPNNPNDTTYYKNKWHGRYIAISGNKVAVTRGWHVFSSPDYYNDYTQLDTSLKAVVMYNISGGSFSDASLSFTTLATFHAGPLSFNPAGNKLAVFNNKSGQNHFVIINV